MNYRDWVREGEAELAAMREPTREEDEALSLELARENAEQAREEEQEMAQDEDTVPGAHADIHPACLVVGEFVEVDEGEFVRAAAVTRVLAMKPHRNGSGSKTFLANVVTGEGGETGSCWSIYPAHKILQALNLALENGRQRRVERAEY